MRRFALILTLVFLVCLIFHQCTRAPICHAKKLIVGTWIKAPPTGNLQQEWIFTSDNDLYIVDVGLTQPALRDTLLSCVNITNVPYKVENDITKNWLHTETLSLFCSSKTNPKWLIYKITKSELYIMTVDDNKSKGAFQFGFVKD